MTISFMNPSRLERLHIKIEADTLRSVRQIGLDTLDRMLSQPRFSNLMRLRLDVVAEDDVPIPTVAVEYIARKLPTSLHRGIIFVNYASRH